MSFNRQFLYQFITRPFKTIVAYAPTYTPTHEGIFVLMLLGLSQGAELGGRFFIVSGFLFTLISLFVVLIQTFVFDFTAQMFKHPSQSLKLYGWLALSNFPLLLKTPLILLEKWWSVFGFGVVALTFALFVSWAALQIYVIRHIYSISLRRALFIYFIPIILILGVFSFVIVSGSLFSILLLQGF